MMTNSRELTEMIRAACVLEARARKPGNVHPERAFADLEYRDFVASAAAAAPALARAGQTGVGAAILAAVSATRERVPRNTNLGIILLIAPLAAVPRETLLRDGIGAVLRGLTREDAAAAYRAIRLARPGGLGSAPQQDVAEEPTVTLLEAMRLAADRDSIAAQYAGDFSLVLGPGLASLARAVDFERSWERAIIRLQLELMALCPDSLIARKCGRETAEEASRRAQRLLELWPDPSAPGPDLAPFDDWLGADGNRRNPGTTADLVAACLFAAFRERVVAVPSVVRRESGNTEPCETIS